ncbi:Aldo/keto reductase [Mycena belliarum]|uniref:Aldo/keto reductase n=1 Tax=Mycena belliarum TaxID=1033014 RepID=A0AAD6TM83_9AGAR|nr:Aldo/keto reductase [Mycena belliae]
MSSWFAPPPPPPTKLGAYRTLSPLAGIHVSPLQLGAMNIGDKWAAFGMGEMDKESKHLWAEKRNIRDQLVIATKYTTGFKARQTDFAQKVNYTGNNLKSLHISVEASLKKLRTTYIDILYVHWWDWDTGIEEVMNGLHNLVVSGKVLYLGISDTPAWVVAQANQYARDHGKSPFVIYQGAWNVLERSFEREIIPMARANGTEPISRSRSTLISRKLEGLALAPWSVLAAGKLRTDAEEEKRRETGEKGRVLSNPQWERNEKEKTMSQALEKIAAEVGAKSITAVAIAYVMHKVPYCFPIVGGRKIEHLDSNIEALDISLSNEQIVFLESILPFDPGFPSAMIGDGRTKPNRLLGMAATFSKIPLLEPIRPTKN